ncbi:MAG: sigma-70 family RNA polymerase sigma factor [Oscillospiraceae bacterium]|nr:sigma-70 family RNA polymerase sigma factor [Oscillospiraceae bacterium]
MEDEQIIALFFQRTETAITRLQEKYGRLCLRIAQRILPDDRDAEECVSDTCLRAWNAIPPEHPRSLSAYLARITRNLALDRYTYNAAERRSTALTCAFEELEFCLPAARGDTEQAVDAMEFHQFLNDFLRGLSSNARTFFLRRYWYGESVREIAKGCHASEEQVKTSLFRTRNRLHDAMEKEKIVL